MRSELECRRLRGELEMTTRLLLAARQDADRAQTELGIYKTANLGIRILAKRLGVPQETVIDFIFDMLKDEPIPLRRIFERAQHKNANRLQP